MKAVSSGLDRVEDAVMVVGMAFITILIACQVVLRYGFGSAIIGAEEMTKHTVIWMCFIGAGMGVRRGTHISVQLISAFVNQRTGDVLTCISAGLGLLFALLMVWFGGSLTLDTYLNGRLTSVMRMPVWMVYIAIPIGGLTLAFRFIEVIAKTQMAILRGTAAEPNATAVQYDVKGGL